MRPITIILSFLLAIGASAQDTAKLEKMLANGRYRAAEARSTGVLHKYPDHVPAFLVRAHARIELGKFAFAEEDIKAAWKNGDASARSQVLMGRALMGQGRADDALASLMLAIEADPSSTEAHYQQGLVQLAAEDAQSAVRSFTVVIERTPDRYQAFRERAAALASLQDTAAARADFDTAIELAPRDPVNWNARGFHRYAQFGEHARALRDYERAIKLDKNYAYVFNNRGWSRYKIGDLKGALKDIRLSDRKKPNNPYVQRNLGVIKLEQGDTTEACINLRRALEQGFSAWHGNEVEELVRAHCGVVPASAKPPQEGRQPAGTTPATNAPGRTNAPGEK